ncbi:Guanylate kinase [Rhizoctonia solani]|nr:Guanylate kinase [Rhizoctonia solani]
MAPSVSRPVVLCGPSGAGKSTLIKKLQDEFPGQYNFSVSHTTRSPRPGEVNGKAYHFVTKSAFEELVNQGGFAEYTTSYDTYYGTSLQAIKEASTEGATCLLDIDTVGVANIKKHHSALGCLFIFISPPTLSSLGDRLRNRGTENEATIVKRLAKAKAEIEYAAAGHFDAIVVNDHVDRAYSVLRSVIRDGNQTGDKLPDGILEETAVSIN